MKWFDFTFDTPAENLACDEALLDFCEQEGEEVLRFWESPVPFVVVGYGNRIATEVNVEECQRRGVPILRRCSGGGTVVQGPGCLNYNLTLRIPETGLLTTVTSTNQLVMERNREAMAKLLGLPVSVQGHTDLAFEPLPNAPHKFNSGFEGAWLKFSGNAQRRRRCAIMFHGTILYGFDLSLIDALLRFPSAQPDYRASRGHTDFVRNVTAERLEIRDCMIAAWGGEPDSKTIPHLKLDKLVRSQYANPDWTLRR